MQGWRTNMEDAHIAISDLGAEHGGLSLFGVFDGHGGREVALFCQKRFPDEIRRQLQSLRGSSQASDKPGGTLGEALRNGFHTMDDLLISPDHERELLLLKQGKTIGSSSSSSPAGPSGSPSGSADADPDASSEEEADERRGREGPEAKDKGPLTREEATQAMMKMALMRRRQDEAAPGSATAHVADSVGCTAVCVLMSQAEVICANAGDSRAIMCRAGKPVELSHDHKPNDETERRRIEAAGGRVEEIRVGPRVHHRVNGNLNLSRAIGDMEYKKRPELGPERQMICSTPDLIAVPLTQEDEFILLACDGIWDVKSNQEVCDFVGARLKRGEAITVIAEALLDDCIAVDPKQTHGIGGDNMTVVIVQLGRPGHGGEGAGGCARASGGAGA